MNQQRCDNINSVSGQHRAANQTNQVYENPQNQQDEAIYETCIQSNYIRPNQDYRSHMTIRGMC